MRDSLRCAWRVLWLATELVLAGVGLAFPRRHIQAGDSSAEQEAIRTRARLMQRHARRLLRVFGVRVAVSGQAPARGLLVSNHLSYLDILVLGSIQPSVFVSKSEVRRWPFLGWLTARAGTLFIQRDKRSDVARINDETLAVLEAGVLVVIFPEGTSSDGCTVLPFRSPLLEPVVSRDHDLAVAHIQYDMPDGNVSTLVCYWGDMTFGSHLLKLLSRRRISASVAFAPIQSPAGDRKELARQLHSEVFRLKTTRPPAVTP